MIYWKIWGAKRFDRQMAEEERKREAIRDAFWLSPIGKDLTEKRERWAKAMLEIVTRVEQENAFYLGRGVARSLADEIVEWHKQNKVPEAVQDGWVREYKLSTVNSVMYPERFVMQVALYHADEYGRMRGCNNIIRYFERWWDGKHGWLA